MDEIKLSIVVPVYNTKKYLSRCVGSLLKQTLNKIEIILVDDGSTDGSDVICDNYAINFPTKVKVVHKQNGGLVSAWKEGVRIACGEYVGFCDSDDYCDDNYYNELFGPIVDDEDVDMVIGGFTQVDEQGNQTLIYKSTIEPGIYGKKEIDTMIKDYFKGKNSVPASRCLKIVRKKIVMDNFDLYNDKIVQLEDLCATFIWLCDICKLAFVNTVGFRYVVYQNSMSHGFNPKALLNFDVLCEYLKDISLSKSYSENYYQELLRQCIKLVLMICISDLKFSEKRKYLKNFRMNKFVDEVLKNDIGALKTKPSKIVKVLYRMRLFDLIIICSDIWRR